MSSSETSPLLPPARPEKMDTSTSPESEQQNAADQTSVTFSSAIQTERGKKPQAIAHRGYKAAYPENTMGAFRGAVEVGAHAIETDIHLSRDGVVMLSHVRPHILLS